MPGIENAMTPAAVVAKLNEAGIDISERTLRERARALGACRVIGKTMFLMPEDVEKIIEAARPEPRVRHRPKGAETSGTVLPSMGYDQEELLRRLRNETKKTSQTHPKGRSKSKG